MQDQLHTMLIYSQESCPLMFIFGLIYQFGTGSAYHVNNGSKLRATHGHYDSIIYPNFVWIVGCLFFLNNRNFSNNIFDLVSIAICDICACAWFRKSLTTLRNTLPTVGSFIDVKWWDLSQASEPLDISTWSRHLQVHWTFNNSYQWK